jgi:type III secretion protein J
MSSGWRKRRLTLLFVVIGLLQACDMDLYTNLGERQANAMLAVLLREGIPATRKVQDDGLLRVVVDEQRFPEAMALLEAAGLPEQTFSNMGQVFKGNGLVSSPVQERAQMIYALSEELSHTISQIDGIVSARVHVVLPDNDLLKRVISPSSASVLVRYDPAIDVNQLIPQIKTLVANGISGLGYDGVSVTAVMAAATATKAGTQPRLGSFLGLWMLEENVPRARLMLGGALLAVIALAGALVTQLWGRRRAQSLYALKDQ